jgi:hypothetical protein
MLGDKRARWRRPFGNRQHRWRQRHGHLEPKEPDPPGGRDAPAGTGQRGCGKATIPASDTPRGNRSIRSSSARSPQRA